MFYGYFQVNKHLNKTIMNTIEEKIEKGQKISQIVCKLKIFDNILLQLENSKMVLSSRGINEIGKNLPEFQKIQQEHIEGIKEDVNKPIDGLKEELDSLF